MPLYVDFKITEGTAELHSIQFNVVMRDWPWPLFECTRWAGDSPLTLTEKEESSERTNERTNERTAETIQHFLPSEFESEFAAAIHHTEELRTCRPPAPLTHSLTHCHTQASKQARLADRLPNLSQHSSPVDLPSLPPTLPPSQPHCTQTHRIAVCGPQIHQRTRWLAGHLPCKLVNADAGRLKFSARGRTSEIQTALSAEICSCFGIIRLFNFFKRSRSSGHIDINLVQFND